MQRASHTPAWCCPWATQLGCDVWDARDIGRNFEESAGCDRTVSSVDADGERDVDGDVLPQCRRGNPGTEPARASDLLGPRMSRRPHLSLAISDIPLTRNSGVIGRSVVRRSVVRWAYLRVNTQAVPLHSNWGRVRLSPETQTRDYDKALVDTENSSSPETTSSRRKSRPAERRWATAGSPPARHPRRGQWEEGERGGFLPPT